jgi:hypothetical protein
MLVLFFFKESPMLNYVSTCTSSSRESRAICPPTLAHFGDTDKEGCASVRSALLKHLCIAEAVSICERTICRGHAAATSKMHAHTGGQSEAKDKLANLKLPYA